MFEHRFHLGRWTAIVLTFAALAAMTCVASGACAGDGPESALVCYAKAHAQRDIEAMESLFAPDYTWVVVVPPRVELFDRETALSASRNMFASPAVESVSLQFEDGYHLAEGREAGTWRIEDLRATLSVKHESAEEPTAMPYCVTLYIRETREAASMYEIYREVTFEGIGCGE